MSRVEYLKQDLKELNQQLTQLRRDYEWYRANWKTVPLAKNIKLKTLKQQAERIKGEVRQRKKQIQKELIYG